MRSKHWLIVAAILLLVNSVTTFGQSSIPRTASPFVLQNGDVLRMVRSGMKSDYIINRILTSACNFDVFPPVLTDLRRRGVPDEVLRVMTVVPYGPPDLSDDPLSDAPPRTATVKMPRGMGILVETLYPVSSADVKEGSTISLAVVQPVYIDGVLTIERGTIAKARVVRVKKAQSWGRGGALTLEMENIQAIDGTRIPVELSMASEGENRGGELAAGVAVTSAIIFPYTAPAALVWGFKKGDDAVVKGSKKFSAILSSDVEIAGLVPEKDRLIYHYAESLKAKMNSTSTPTSFPRMSVRN